MAIGVGLVGLYAVGDEGEGGEVLEELVSGA